MNKKETKKGSLGFVGFLTLIFIILKLTNIINWSWIWVFSPIWISAIVLVLIFGIILVAGKMKKGKW